MRSLSSSDRFIFGGNFSLVNVATTKLVRESFEGHLDSSSIFIRRGGKEPKKRYKKKRIKKRKQKCISKMWDKRKFVLSFLNLERIK